PTLLTVFGLYKPTTSAKAVVDAIQEEVQRIARQGVPAADLGRAKTKMRSDFYAGLELPIYRADSLAQAQLLSGSAASLNEMPAIAQSRLPNGLVVWVVKRPGFPRVAAVLAVRGGTAADPRDAEGITELLADTVKEGTTTRTSRQIAEELQAVGGEIGANGAA